MDVVKAPDIDRERAFCLLVDGYQTPLLRMCYLHLHDRQLAEDAVQETFLKAYRAWLTYRGECSEKTWLMKIAVNTCRDQLRKGWFRHVDHAVSLDMLPEEGAPPSVEESAVTSAIARLPEKLRVVVLLYYYQHMTVAEVAHAVGVSQPAVTGRLKRARECLRAALEGGYFDE